MSKELVKQQLNSLLKRRVSQKRTRDLPSSLENAVLQTDSKAKRQKKRSNVDYKRNVSYFKSTSKITKDVAEALEKVKRSTEKLVLSLLYSLDGSIS